jgi:hypothetical protein
MVGPVSAEDLLKNDVKLIPTLATVNHLERLTSLWFTLRDASPPSIEARLNEALGLGDFPEAEVIEEILRYRKGELTEVQAIRNIFELLKEFVEVDS